MIKIIVLPLLGLLGLIILVSLSIDEWFLRVPINFAMGWIVGSWQTKKWRDRKRNAANS